MVEETPPLKQSSTLEGAPPQGTLSPEQGISLPEETPPLKQSSALEEPRPPQETSTPGETPPSEQAVPPREVSPPEMARRHEKEDGTTLHFRVDSNSDQGEPDPLKWARVVSTLGRRRVVGVRGYRGRGVD